MKKKHVFFFLFFVVINIVAVGQERVFERIEVIQQEILVRVFSGSQPVPGLKAGDFILYEDGKKVKINYCRELRRSLAQPEGPAGVPTAAVRRPRLFLFMLWFNEESREWPKAWEYFLSKIYRAGDRIVLSDGAQAIEVSSPEKDKEKTSAFFTGMAERLKNKKLEKVRLVNELENAAADFHNNLVSNPYEDKKDVNLERNYLANFKQRFKDALDEYRLARLKGYPRLLGRLAEVLKNVEAEKWALVFLQNERLPLIDRKGRLFTEAPMKQETISELRRFMDETERQVQFGTDIMSYFRDLQPLFVGANATFHLFLSDAEGEMLSNEHLQWQPVFSSWEGTFRNISADTGGRVSNTTKLGEALQKAAAREDIYYVLTFQPAEDRDHKRDIRVEVSRPNMKAVYSRKLTMGELFPLKIQGLDWQGGILKISLSDFQRMVGESGLAGRLRVSVRAETTNREPLAVEKEILPVEPAVDVEMRLKFPAPGRYQVKVEVEDLLSGNKARAEKEIEILLPPAPPSTPAAPLEPPVMSADLAEILDLAAGYCRRLKEGAFRFYCLENIEERVLERNPLKQGVEHVERHWRYDYQITGAGGEIKEQRRSIKNTGLKAGKEGLGFETRFSSRYSVFMPVTLLAVENRGKYGYRLLGRERLKKRRCAVVQVSPLDQESGDIAQGKVWIDEANGSVLKIAMNPRGVAGSQALEEAARSLSAHLELVVTHLYLVVHEGLCFPSETEFIECYNFDKNLVTRELGPKEIDYGTIRLTMPYLEKQQRRVEFYRLRQMYTKYKFFQVESQEEIKNIE